MLGRENHEARTFQIWCRHILHFVPILVIIISFLTWITSTHSRISFHWRWGIPTDTPSLWCFPLWAFYTLVRQSGLGWYFFCRPFRCSHAFAGLSLFKLTCILFIWCRVKPRCRIIRSSSRFSSNLWASTPARLVLTLLHLSCPVPRWTALVASVSCRRCRSNLWLSWRFI